MERKVEVTLIGKSRPLFDQHARGTGESGIWNLFSFLGKNDAKSRTAGVLSKSMKSVSQDPGYATGTVSGTDSSIRSIVDYSSDTDEDFWQVTGLSDAYPGHRSARGSRVPNPPNFSPSCSGNGSLGSLAASSSSSASDSCGKVSFPVKASYKHMTKTEGPQASGADGSPSICSYTAPCSLASVSVKNFFLKMNLPVWSNNPEGDKDISWEFFDSKDKPRQFDSLSLESGSDLGIQKPEVSVICSVEMLYQQLSHLLEELESSGGRKVCDTDHEIGARPDADLRHVVSWVDFGHNLGFGYELSDKALVVAFDDLSRLTLAKDWKGLIYVDMRGKERTYTLDVYPRGLGKKVKMLLRLMDYVSNGTCEDSQDEGCKASICSKNLEPFRIKYFYDTPSATVMILSNKNVQINRCQDHMKLVFHPGKKMVKIVQPARGPKVLHLDAVKALGCTSLTKDRLEFAHSKLKDALCPKVARGSTSSVEKTTRSPTMKWWL